MNIKQNYSNNNLMYKPKNHLVYFLSNSILMLFILASLFYVGFSYVYISTPVIGRSMQPTLNFTGGYNSDVVYVNRFEQPKKQDIVVIKQAGAYDVLYIIKRVIATPGDHVNIVLNDQENTVELYVNNVKQIEPYLYDYTSDTEYPENNGMFTTLINFNALRQAKPELFNSNGELVVPQGQVFVLGDNRGLSEDSSIHGPFNLAAVVGCVDFIVPYGEKSLTYFANVFTPFKFS